MKKIQIGGSPCTYWSIARAATNSPITRETKNDGLGWQLFENYLIALGKFQPDIWLYENVASMHEDIRSSINAHLDCEPYEIDGGLFSAAERPRLWWTNIKGVETPKDKGLVLGDILEPEVPEKYFYNYPITNVDMTKQVCATMECKNHEMHKRVFNPKFKIHTLTAVGGGGQQKKVLIEGRARKLTPVEYERCMTLPDNYTAGVADSHRYKMLGNGWTAEVVIYILSFALANVPRDEEIVVLSMYDGLATGRYCLEKMGFTNVRYYAYEIDEPAKFIAMKNYPDIIQLGDAFDLRRGDWELGKTYADAPPTETKEQEPEQTEPTDLTDAPEDIKTEIIENTEKLEERETVKVTTEEKTMEQKNIEEQATAKENTPADFCAVAQLRKLTEERKALANLRPEDPRFSNDVRALEYAATVLEAVGL